LATFSLTTLAWIFFRSPDLTSAFQYIIRMFSADVFHMPTVFPIYLIVLIMGLLAVEWNGKNHHFALEGFSKYSVLVRYPIYYTILILLFVYAGRLQQFIYFQF